MGQIKISAEILAKLKEFGADGKISDEEKRALEKAGASAELMEAIATKDIKVEGDNVLFTTRKKQVESKEDDRPWYKKAWDAAKAPLAVIGGGAAVGAAVGSIVPGLGTLMGAAVGGLGGLLMMGMTSCSEGGPFDEPDIKIEDNSKTEVNVQLSVKVEQKITEINNGKNDEIVALLKTLLDKIDAGNKISQQNNVMLTKILDALTSQNLDNADIKALLQKVLATLNQAIAENRELSQKQTEVMNAILAAISKLDSGVSAKLLAIIDKIDSMGSNNYAMLVDILNEIKNGNADNSKLLEAILDQVIKGNEQNKDMDAKTHKLLIDILNSIGNFENSMKDAIAAVIAKLGDVSVMTADNKALLEAILAKMGEMDAGNQANFAAILNAIAEGNQINAEGVKVLTAILNKLDKMDASTQANFKAVIDMLVKGNDINTAILNKLNQVLAKLNKIDANQASFFAQVLANFDKLEAGQQANLDKILEAIANNTSAINQNTQVAKATYDLVAKLLANMDELKNDTNVNMSAILEAIANISVGGSGNVDLSTIEQLLRDLLKSSEMNNTVLTNIEAKLEAVSVTLGGIKVMLGEGHESIIKKLDEILAKIPNGCKCDITVIIAKLDELIEAIKKNPDDDKKHEGILDDLEDLFN